MADKLVVRDPVFTLDGVDLTAYLRGATLTFGATVVEFVISGSGSKEREGGILDNSLSVDLVHPNDMSILTHFKPLMPGKVAFTFKMKNATIGSSNPEFSGNVVLSNLPLGGTVGEGAAFTWSLPVDGLVAMDTTP